MKIRHQCITFLILLVISIHPALSVAITLPGDNTISAAERDQQAPAICSGANSMLAVWSDARSNPYGFYEYETAKDIYGMRIDLSGNAIDALPLALVSRQSNQENPKVAWNGTNWLLVYESYDVGGTGYYYQKSLEAVRVSTAGQVLDSKPIKIFGLTPFTGSWAVASDSNNWVIVNTGSSVNGDIIAVRVSPQGVLLDPPTRSMVKATYYTRTNLKLAYAAGVFFLTFEDDYANGLFTTSAIRFDANLNLLDGSLIRFLDRPLADLTSNGAQFFAVWNQQLPDYSMAITGSRVSAAGQKLDGAGKNISGNFAADPNKTIGVVWDGINWKANWVNNNALRIARISTTGAVLDPGGIALAGPQSGPAAGTGNGGIQIVWTVYNNNNYDVRSANISSANVAGANRDLSLGSPQQLRSDIAASGNGYMMVYRSSNASQNRILAMPLDASGAGLMAQPVSLDTSSNTSAPNVAWNGSVYLVSWGNANGVVAQRLSPTGVKLDSQPFVVMNPAFGPADVAALGSNFLIVARRFGYTPEIINTIAARVRGTDGAVLDASPLALSSWFARPPAVTTLGGQWLVAFHNNATHDNPSADTLGAFVSATGTVTNFNIHGPFSTSGGNGIFEVALASSGTVALMVQSQELSSGVETDLLARTISSNGTVGPVINLTPWIGNQYRPRAFWDGANFVVVYQEQKNRVALHTLDQLDARSDLFGMRITPAGSKIDPQGFVFSARATAETDPNIVSLNGLSLLSGSLLLNEAGLLGYRIVYNQIGQGGNKWPVAVINSSTTGGDVSLPVNFSSSGSMDPDGTIASYQWNFGDGFTSTSANPSHTFTSPGNWLVTLRVTDNQGAQTTQALMLTATSPNILPVAVASADKVSGNAPLDVIFYADGSYDPDGFTGNLEWMFSDGGTYWGSPAYYTFASSGNYTATLRVYDSRGGTGMSSISINVTGVNQPPVANASATPSSGTAPLTVAFSCSGSSDPDGTIVSYHWDFGDAIGSSNLANPTYTYSYPGTYTATLVVTDNNNVNSSDAVVITASQSTSNVLRSTAINLSGTVRQKKVNITGQVTVRNGSNAAVSGATVSVKWRKPNGSTVTQSATTNTSGVAGFSSSGTTGTYTITVTNITKAGYTFDAANSILSKSITK